MVGSVNTIGVPSFAPNIGAAGSSTAGTSLAGTTSLGGTTSLAGSTLLPASSAVSTPTQLQQGPSVQLMQMMMQLLMAVVQLCCGSLGGGSLAGSAAQIPAASGGTATGGTVARTASTPARPRVLVIDDFSSNQNGFQHGTEMVNTIRRQAGQNVDIQQRNVAGQGTAGIRNALQDVLNQARQGNKVTDVINISLFDGQNSADAQAVRQIINELDAQGIKVVAAAGNNGPNQANQLAVGTRAQVVSNGTGQSGPGTVQGNGRTTSFATADVTARIALGLLG